MVPTMEAPIIKNIRQSIKLLDTLNLAMPPTERQQCHKYCVVGNYCKERVHGTWNREQRCRWIRGRTAGGKSRTKVSGDQDSGGNYQSERHGRHAPVGPRGLRSGPCIPFLLQRSSVLALRRCTHIELNKIIRRI